MIGTLLRADGGAASFTLGSLWPMRWPAFPVALFDFDMFNDVADAHWERAKARCAERAQLTSAAETVSPATTLTAAPQQKTAPRSAPSPQRPARGNHRSPSASSRTPRMRCAVTSLIVSDRLR